MISDVRVSLTSLNNFKAVMYYSCCAGIISGISLFISLYMVPVVAIYHLISSIGACASCDVSVNRENCPCLLYLAIIVSVVISKFEVWTSSPYFEGWFGSTVSKS